MEKGYVISRFTVCLFIGAAGSGKSHTKNLVLQEPPPPIRCSTPLLELPIRAISVIRATVSGMTAVWRRITIEELYRMLGDTIKAGGHVSISSSPLLTRIKNFITNIAIPRTSPASKATDTVSVSSSTPSEAANVQEEATQDNVSDSVASHAPLQDEAITLPEQDQLTLTQLEEELVDLIAKSKGSQQLLELDWVYLLDSGGQSQFIEILPVFVRKTSAAIFVQKLNEELRHKPTVDLYDENGQKCGYSYTSALTNEQLLKHYFRAMQSRLCASENSRIFVVGTHRDKEHECPEKLAEKDCKLLNILRPTLGDRLAFYRLTEPERVIYPVNAKAPVKEDHKVAEELRRAVVDKCMGDPVKIPLPWFVFEQFV